MSEYFLADVRAQERARQRDREKELEQNAQQPKQAQEMRITLLGDFLFATTEEPGCDPYNAVNGKSSRDVWKTHRDRR